MYKAYRDADTGEPAALPQVVSDLTIMFIAGELNMEMRKPPLISIRLRDNRASSKLCDISSGVSAGIMENNS